MANYTLLVPPIYQSELTGLLGGMARYYRGHTYRADLYRSGWSISKDGKPLRSWDDLPRHVQASALDAKRVLMEAHSLK